MTKLSASQVARRLGLSTARVAQLREAGELESEQTPLGYLYDEVDVAELERSRSKTTRGKAADSSSSEDSTS